MIFFAFHNWSIITIIIITIKKSYFIKQLYIQNINRLKIIENYKLKRNDDGWYAYDVVIEGVSLVNNYRSTFTAIIKSEGMSGLLSDMQGRIDRYKLKNGGLPPQ